MNIKIIEDVECLLSNSSGYYDIISIRNSDKLIPEVIQKYSRSYLDLIFDDIDCPFGNYILPSNMDVEKAINYARNLHTIVITCTGKGTRAAALKYVLNCMYKTPKDSIKEFEFNDHPNRIIVKYGSEILNKPEIYDEFKRWKGKRV